MTGKSVGKEFGLEEIPLLVLAGGMGTRLAPVWKDSPKILAPVNGRPYFDWFVESMRKSGFHKIVFLLGFGCDQVVRHIESMNNSVGLTWVIEKYPLGTGGAVKFALADFEDERCFLMNGDSYCKIDYADLWRSHRDSGALATMALSQVEDCRDFGTVHQSAEGWVKSFEEKNCNGGSGWVNAGVYIFERNCLEHFPAKERFSMEKEVFPKLCEARLLRGYRCPGSLLDIGTPERLQRAQVELVSLMK